MKPDEDTPSSQLAAAGLILIASAFIAASTLCAKMLGTGGNPLSALQVTWGRYAFGLSGLLVVMLAVRPTLNKPKAKIHAVRVLTGVAGVTCMFAAAALIPLADVTAISFLNPIFVMIFAIPILGEKVGKVRWSLALLALFGGLLLVRPGTTAFEPAALLALAAAILLGMEAIVLKMLADSEGSFQIILIANAMGALITTMIVSFVWISPTSTQWLLIVGTGLLMVTAQGFFTNALRIGEASFVLPFSYATLLFAALYDFVLFDVIPVPLSIVGGTIIIVSGCLLAWREHHLKKAATE